MISGVIAEIGNAHNGSLQRAHRLIEESAKAGASAAKFQCYTIPELCTLRGTAKDEMVTVEPWTHMTMGELYGLAETPHSWFPSLIRKCKEVGIPWFSSVFGMDSLALLEKLGCPVYKLASLDRSQDIFRRNVMQTGKPVIQSSPEPMLLKGVTQLYCPVGYPSEPYGISDAAIKEAMTIFDGFSYHGTNPEIPLFAKECGAKIIEVHVQLDDEPSELEQNVCLTISQLRELTGRRDLGKVRGKRTRGRTTVTAKMGKL